jgi:hypothetical protein
MLKYVALFAALFVIVFFVVALLVVVAPTQEKVSGSSVVSDAADSVSDAVDSVNEAIENSPVGEAIEKMDAATGG